MTGDVSLRPVGPDDMHRLFEWRNDPWIISLGSSRRVVSREEHERWFHDVLRSDEHLLFIIAVDGEPAGQIRFKRLDDGSASVSIYLLRPYTGRGYGVTALKQASALAFDQWPVPRVLAFVLEGNRPSQAAFQRAGYRPVDSGIAAPDMHRVFVLER